SLRHHYLEGAAPPSELASARRQAIGRHLRERITTFEALDLLYRKAHLVGHVLLPQLAIFSRAISREDAVIADLDRRDATSVDSLVGAALSLYRRATEEFAQYGAREASYLQAEILNLEMIATVS